MSLIKHTLKQARRIVVFILGMTTLIIGIALIFLPGPAILIIPLGLLILSTEFIWAKRFLQKVRKLTLFTQSLNFDIQTERYHIKRLNESDYGNIQFMRTDDKIKRLMRKRETFEHLFHRLLKHQQKHGFSIGSVYEKQSETLIGCAGLIYLNLEESQSEVEVIAFFPPQFSDHQEEVIKSCLNWGFRNLHLDKILGISGKKEVGERLERAGMHFVEECEFQGIVCLKYSSSR